MANIRNPALKLPVSIAEYLFTRLHQMGVRSVHGVPGDYNLTALDFILDAGLKWVGNVNELNAGYAADGYSRVNGISALVTTFGVGELSALNAIAGAYSENVPIVHIVGTPSRRSQKEGALLHHTLGNGKYNVFSDMYRWISCATGEIHNPENAAAVIDHTLQQCWLKSQPVYISLPTDMATKKIEGESLNNPIDLKHCANDAAKEEDVVGVIMKKLIAAKNPIILVDTGARRYQTIKNVHSLIKKTKLPVFVTPMGKGAVDETDDSYMGLYNGDGSQPEVQKRVESSDLVLMIGPMKSDINTSGFTARISQHSVIEFHNTNITVGYSKYTDINMRDVLQRITNQLDLSKLSTNKIMTSKQVAKDQENSSTITHTWFWSQLSSFLKENDIVITESGTPNFGILETKFPKGVHTLSQILWGSIGYSVGACQGAALAARDAGDNNRRTLLFVGDGSFQLTCQEISTIIRLGLKPLIFVICNEGYTTERLIHGKDSNYNNIQPWLFKDIIKVFGAQKDLYKTYQVKSKEEVIELFKDEEFSNCNVLQFVELHMPKYDAPRALRVVAEMIKRRNSAS